MKLHADKIIPNTSESPKQNKQGLGLETTVQEPRVG